MHQYVYVSFPLDGDVDQDHVEEGIGDLAVKFGGKDCGSGTGFDPPVRDLDYEFSDTTVWAIGEFVDAVYAAFPFATARLGSQSWEQDTDR